MTAAAAVKAPSRAARRDPIEIRRFHNNSYANQTWTSNSGDEFPHRGGNDRPALTRRRSRRNLGRHAAVVDAAMVEPAPSGLTKPGSRPSFFETERKVIAAAPKCGSQALSRYRVADLDDNLYGTCR
jgi:hypothetical protein